MKYAKLLDFKLEKPVIKKSVVLGEYGKVPDEEKASVTQMYMPKKYVEYVREELPKAIQDKVVHINYAEIRVSGPHIHTTEQCVINYYLETNDEITAFYEGDAKVDHELVVDSGNDYYPIDENTVHEVEHFVAKSGEIWLMSTVQPHSVGHADDTRVGRERYRHINGKFRKVIQIYLDMPYDQVASIMQ